MTGRNYFPLVTTIAVPAAAGGMIKLTPQYEVPLASLSEAFLIVPAVGTAGIQTVTFNATYAVGDLIRLTITSNLTSRQLWRKSYTHTVQAGLVLPADISAAFAAMVQADVNNVLNSPYASVVDNGGNIVITQFDDDKRGLVAYTFTDSASGSLAAVLTPTVISEGQPSDLEDRGVDTDDITLAAYDTVRMVLKADAPIPFIDSDGKTVKEIYWYGPPGDGAGLVAQIP